MTRKITLKQARVLNNLRQDEAAKRLGITPETLSRWERGISYPDVKSLKMMEDLYHVKYDDLIFLGLDIILNDIK